MASANPWARVRDAFDRAVALEGAERSDFLDRLADEAPDLVDEVRALLEADQRHDGLLEAPLVDSFVTTGLGASRPSDENEPAPHTGERIGPYRVGPRIGRGGMGDVYLAERDAGGFDQRVALKMIRRGMDSADVTRRFHQERRILAGLQHPGIARLIDGGVTADGQAWFSMEYVEGTPITTYCEGRNLGLRARLSVFLEACEAVRHAHRRLVVHRDLKPSNILVTPEGTVKLLDFGIAKALDPDENGDEPLTRGFVRPLTPQYASPEQLMGETVTIGADVYSLGVVLYELVAGAHPHASQTTAEQLRHAVLTTTPAPPSAAVGRGDGGVASIDRVDRDIDNICMMALRKETARRYPSVGAMAEDVERYLAGHPVVATPDSRGYRVGKFVTRNRVAVVGTAAAVVAVVGLTGAFMARLAVERNRARLEAANAAEVSAFLEGLFAVSDPYVGTEREMTARQLLDEGARRIDTDLEGQPDLQARMHTVVGNTYRGLGVTGEARRHHEEALALARTLYGPESPQAADAMAELAYAIISAGEDFEVVDSLYAEVLAIRTAQVGPDHPDVARTNVRRALIHNQLGEFEEGERLARGAAEVLRAELGEESADLTEALRHLALALRRQGRFREAEEVGREALAMAQRVLDPTHPDVGVVMNNLALVLEQLGEYPEAEALLRERVRITEARMGSLHPTTLIALNNLAFMLWRTGEYDEAESAFRSVVATARSDSLGAESPHWASLAIFINNLAVAVLRRGDAEEARELQREAIAINRQVLGDRHPRIAADLLNLARMELRLGHIDEAERLGRESLELRLELLPPDHPEVAESRTNLAEVLAQRGRLEEADALLTAAVESLGGVDGEATPRLADTMESLADVRGRLLRADEAEGLLRRVVEMRTEMLGPEHPEVADALRHLGVELAEIDRHAEAEELLLRAHAIVREGLAEDDPLAAQVRSDLADLYERWGRGEEAERWRETDGADDPPGSGGGDGT